MARINSCYSLSTKRYQNYYQTCFTVEDVRRQLERQRPLKFLHLKKRPFIDPHAWYFWLVLWLLKRFIPRKTTVVSGLIQSQVTAFFVLRADVFLMTWKWPGWRCIDNDDGVENALENKNYSVLHEEFACLKDVVVEVDVVDLNEIPISHVILVVGVATDLTLSLVSISL